LTAVENHSIPTLMSLVMVVTVPVSVRYLIASVDKARTSKT